MYDANKNGGTLNVNKKEAFTYKEIEKDIADFIKYPPGDSEPKNKLYEIIAAVAFIAVIAVMIAYPPFALMLFPLVIVIPTATLVFLHFRVKHLIKNVTIDDYRVTRETVHCVYVENYTVTRHGTGGRSHQIEVYNYSVHFEDGRKWHIPAKCYGWSERYRMNAAAVCESTHMGDTMTVVTKKETDEIVAAYNAEYFEYKG